MATSHGTSSTGANVVVCQSSKTCYVSSDSGSTFVAATSGLTAAQVQPSIIFPPGRAVVMSSSGSKVLVATLTSSYGASGLYVSVNSGVDYTVQAGPGSQIWISVAMSSDGNKMAALTASEIWTSSDGGNSWTSTALPFTAYFYGSTLAMSGDGTQLLATTVIVGNGIIYTSSDFGSTWTLARKLCDNVLATCTASYLSSPYACGTQLSTAVSQTGSVMSVSVLFGGLYISTDTGNTWVIAQ